MQSEHLAKIVHAKFQVNAAIFVGAKPKKVEKMSFLQHFTKSSITFFGIQIRIDFFTESLVETQVITRKSQIQ